MIVNNNFTQFEHFISKLRQKSLLREEVPEWASEKAQTRTHAKQSGTKGMPANVLNFASNNYLNLSNNTEDFTEAIKGMASLSACASKFLGGYNKFYVQIEEQLKQIHNTQHCAILSSGYLANLAAIQAIGGLCNLFIIDEEAHASMIDGLSLAISPYTRRTGIIADARSFFASLEPHHSEAHHSEPHHSEPHHSEPHHSEPHHSEPSMLRTAHATEGAQTSHATEGAQTSHATEGAQTNSRHTAYAKPRIIRQNLLNTQALSQTLEKHRANYNNCLIITEHISSMSGKLIDTNTIANIAKQYSCFLITDHAHSMGVLPLDNHPAYQGHIKVSTLSKAVAAIGGGISSNSAAIHQFISNAARPNIYNSAMPIPALALALTNLQRLQQLTPCHGMRAIQNAQTFVKSFKPSDDKLTIHNPYIGTEHQQLSQIVFIEASSTQHAQALHQKLRKRNILTSLIRRPTFKYPGVRLSFHANHTTEDIRHLLNAINE